MTYLKHCWWKGHTNSRQKFVSITQDEINFVTVQSQGEEIYFLLVSSQERKKH